MKREGKKLWVWGSVAALRRYGNGQVIVMANRKPEAIIAAVEQYRAEISELRDYLEPDEIANLVNVLHIELETTEPKMFDGFGKPAVVIIEGSE